MPDINTYDSDFAEELTRVIKAGQATGTVRACLLTTRDRNFALSLGWKKRIPIFSFRGNRHESMFKVSKSFI